MFLNQGYFRSLMGTTENCYTHFGFSFRERDNLSHLISPPPQQSLELQTRALTGERMQWGHIKCRTMKANFVRIIFNLPLVSLIPFISLMTLTFVHKLPYFS